MLSPRNWCPRISHAKQQLPKMPPPQSKKKTRPGLDRGSNPRAAGQQQLKSLTLWLGTSQKFRSERLYKVQGQGQVLQTRRASIIPQAGAAVQILLQLTKHKLDVVQLQLVDRALLPEPRNMSIVHSSTVATPIGYTPWEKDVMAGTPNRLGSFAPPDESTSWIVGQAVPQKLTDPS